MAQTRKRRQTKHRGNAAGRIEARGRTGRKLTPDERKQLTPKEKAAARRQTRFDTPPTWRGALTRASIAAVLFVLVALTLLRQPVVGALAFGLFALALYVPLGYYTDLFFYQRRQRAKQRASARAGEGG
jgi:hypothetical protein